MPSDNRNNPPKPQTNKDQKLTDLPQKKGNTAKDSQIKGGGGGGRGEPEELDAL